MLPPEIRQAILSSLMESHEEKKYTALTTIEQKDRLKAHLKTRATEEKRQAKMTEGMFIRRNKKGSEMYKFPAKGQLAMIMRKFPRLTANDRTNVFENAEIAVIHEGKDIHTYTVDLTYYEIDPQSKLLEKN